MILHLKYLLFERKKQQEYLCQLSITLDLVAMGMESGLDFNLALQRVCQYGPQGILQKEFQMVLKEISLGEKRLHALGKMAKRIGLKPLRTVIQAIHLSETLGGNLAAILQTEAQSLREERLFQAEEKAQLIPVKLIFPLIFLIFPCVFIVLFGPIIFRLLQMEIW